VKYETVAKFDLPNCIHRFFLSDHWFASIEIPVTVSVVDADGDWTSFLCNVADDAIVEMVISEDESKEFTVKEFCAIVGITQNKLGEFCMTDKIRMESQHLFIYGNWSEAHEV